MSADFLFVLRICCLSKRLLNCESCRSQIGAGCRGLDDLVNVFEEGVPRCEVGEICSRICAFARFDTTMKTSRVGLYDSVIVIREIREACLHCGAGSKERRYQSLRRRDGGVMMAE